VVRRFEEYVTVADDALVYWSIRPNIIAAPSGRLQQA
jgi:hypothetical protein